MSFRDDFKVAAGKRVDLSAIDPGMTAGFDKDSARAQTQKNIKRIAELQKKLYVERKQAVLIVFQAIDAGGKDGAIENLATGTNPQGVKVTSFKQPSREELDHDFLWRIHPHAPGKGEIGIFNRSHYEDVLVVRVHGLAPEDVWQKRYRQINDFERMLSENGTHIIKFYLHISKEEQFERLRARLEDPAKNWKFNEGDMKERDRWDDYRAAFEDALTKCSTPEAPWHVIPADKKWFRDLVISEIVRDKLESLNISLPKVDFDAQDMLQKYFGASPA